MSATKTSVKNFYQIFKLGEPVYNIDKKELKSNYIKLLHIIHPNNSAYLTKNLYKLSEKITSELNGGYKLLNNDIQRGKYLLILKTNGDKNILNENLKYVYTTDIEVNNILKELYFLDESIRLYMQNNNLFELKKLYNICKYNTKVMENKFDEIIRKNDRFYIARFYLLILEKCKKQVHLINNYIYN